jgi:two-component system, NtrC family, sensor kinase
MLTALHQFLDTSSFIPHGHCYLWKPGLVWLNVVSDALIAVAYFSIPVLLIYIVLKREDLPFNALFLLFGSFIIACGTGHLMDVWTLWHPAYWLSGAIKALTAVISLATAIALIFLTPQILALPSPRQLEDANQKLENEILERQQAEYNLQLTLQRLKFHVENSPLAVVEWDQAFRVQRWSKRAEELFGWKAEEIVGKQPQDWHFVYPEDVTAIEQTMTYLMDGTVPRNICRNRNYTKDGTIIHCEWYNSALFNESGEFESTLSLVLNVTEGKQAEQALRESEFQLRRQTQTLEKTLQELRETQSQLIQTEKMSSLGQLVAGVAHEINNPVNFIYGNLSHIEGYAQDLMDLIRLYQHHYPNPIPEIDDRQQSIELDFLAEDLPRILASMTIGADRIRQIVLSLRNFSRFDQAEMKEVDIHEGIDSTLLILHHRLKISSDNLGIQVIKNYGSLPQVECYAGQLNQVFMNILSNAIDAVEDANNEKRYHSDEPSTIQIDTTKTDDGHVLICIADNGVGMSESVRSRLFDPFFTTKPIGKGTGLGLSISYQIVVEKHGGTLGCTSKLGEGTEFQIKIPIKARQLVHNSAR